MMGNVGDKSTTDIERAIRSELDKSSSLSTNQRQHITDSLYNVYGLKGGGGISTTGASFADQIEALVSSPSPSGLKSLWTAYKSSGNPSTVNAAAMGKLMEVLSDNSKLQEYITAFLDSEYMTDVVNTELLPTSIVKRLKHDFSDTEARNHLEDTVNTILADTSFKDSVLKGGGANGGMSKIIKSLNTFGIDTDTVMDMMKHTIKGDFRKTVDILMDHFLPDNASNTGLPSSTLYPGAPSPLKGGGGSLNNQLMSVDSTPYEIFTDFMKSPHTYANDSMGKLGSSAITDAQDQYEYHLKRTGTKSRSSLELGRSLVKGVLAKDSRTLQLVQRNAILLTDLLKQ
jgi:hypothetical protein